ncbi:formyltransferase family protein [Desulfobacterales bacterium HSG17]|nr:formyltransferase family protein [Desulfobacterales bacterium HSG17]
MRIIIFVNDSFFSYLLAKPIIELFHENIQAVIFSSQIKGSLLRIIDVYRKTHWRYFTYRVLVDVLSRINAFRGSKTVISLVRKYNLRYIISENINSDQVIDTFFPIDIGIAFNFDQIIKKKFLTIRYGVFNVHASKLPNDKGISPVLWAFARGDNSIWSTIYRMGDGIDTGCIFKQIELPVKKEDTAFSVYERVCSISGEELVTIVKSIKDKKLKPISYSSEDDGNYWSWPNNTHKLLMKKAKRKFINIKNVLKLLNFDHK